MNGVLQVVPVEVGAQVQAGANRSRASPTRRSSRPSCALRKRRPRTSRSARSPKSTRSNGVVAGKVSRIDPASANGTVGVDITLEGALPPGARPDLSVDGTVRLQKLDDVIFVGRPAFGQEESTITLFKLSARRRSPPHEGGPRPQLRQHHRDPRGSPAGGSGDSVRHVVVRPVRPGQTELSLSAGTG